MGVYRKHLFQMPEGMIYLDGNSLGPLPKLSMARAQQTIQGEWGQHLIRAWNDADWITLPKRVGDRIASLIGAPTGSVATGDTLSIKVYQALAAALKMRPKRKVILSDRGNFPSDLYMAQGLINTIDKGYELRLCEPGEIENNITPDVAVVMLTQADYRSGRLHDMASITNVAHQAGAVMIWDLAHTAGAIEVDIAGSNAEFAVGCTYKYLNGGPGAPAFIYVRPDLVQDIQPALSGWLGHNAPFAMDLDYRPAMSTERMRVGTPSIVQLAILDAALDAWIDVSMVELRAECIALCEQFIQGVEARCPELTLASPRDGAQRGSQVSFAFEHGYAAIQALVDRGVVGDFRAPNIMRFGFTPLYVSSEDVQDAVDHVAEVMATRAWAERKYQTKSKVT